MGTIRMIGIADFERLLDAWQPVRRIDAFHVHHTWRPRHRDFRGLATIESMRRFHMQQMGMSDIAQHLSIDPLGGIWTGRPFDRPPGSARGHNGNASSGPFMIEMIGDFDRGQDPFDGEQKRIAQAVVVAVLRKFGLDESAVRFHAEFSEKTCPGSGLDLRTFRGEIKALLASGARVQLPRRSDAVLDEAAVRDWHGGAGARGDDGGAAAFEEPMFAEVPESEWLLAQQEYLAELIDTGRDAARGGRDIDVQPLLPHVVNLSEGLLSTQGDFSSSLSSLRTIVEQHLPAYLATHDDPHLVFYAHGGLVSEPGALCYARTILPWWLAHGVYPIFFVWESGLLDTLRNSPRGGQRNIFTDWLIEGVTQVAARKVWKMMKEDAENASSPFIAKHGKPGGAHQLAALLDPLLKSHPGLKLHAIGHSTGPILLSKFMPLLTDKGHRFETLSYLAPAIRTDRFRERVVPLLQDGRKPVKDLTIYTMTDAAERDDTVAKVYRKSLLYFVRNACEDKDDGRVLGLAKDLADDKELKALFGIGKGGLSFRNGPFAIEFSPPRDVQPQNPKTEALRHGGFDNDAATMFSVLARILGRDPSVEVPKQQFPGDEAFERCGDAGRGVEDEDDADAGIEGDCGCPCCCCRDKAPTPDRFGDDVPDDPDDDGGDSAANGANAPAVDERKATPAGKGKGKGKRPGNRRALCIGINAYPTAPLSGCVNDSRRWGETLADLGFKVESLTDKQATRAAIMAGLRKLVSEARPGDELVFQYAGHGSQIEDLDGDESDSLDEAFVPVDYQSGELLIDDDFHAITTELREGAFLTLFMDCCHSGSNSRFAPLRVTPRGDERVRFMTLDETVRKRFVALRANTRGGLRLRAGARGERIAVPGVVHFAACLDSEFAWESGGSGDFTRIATPMLAEAVRSGKGNQAFMDAVVAKFGKTPRQNPRLLKPAGSLSKRLLLGG
ncbi:MAG: caspase family protein [Xanthomonadaceae bacterium]|nr:caspase family protein [Xanthomonadaceae bacterium]